MISSPMNFTIRPPPAAVMSNARASNRLTWSPSAAGSSVDCSTVEPTRSTKPIATRAISRRVTPSWITRCRATARRMW
jgi:hypothetical protein